MAYQIDKFNKEFLTSVEDGTIDQTTDLTFIGKNYAGYGEFHNENFLFLLENFASSDGPSKPMTGQIWFDTANSKLKFYDGNQWRTSGGAETSAGQPAGLSVGDFWWDSSNDQLYVFNGSSYVLVGPQDAGEGITQMSSQTISDINDVNRSVIVSYIDTTPIFVISNDQFIIKNIEGNTLDGFTTIRQGITLRDTETESGETASNFRFYGTATTAEGLLDSSNNFVNADNFLRADNTNFENLMDFDLGLTVSSYLKVFLDSNNDGIITNQSPASNNNIVLKTTNSSSQETSIITINSTGILPAQNDTFDLGSSTLKFRNIYADSIVGGTASNTDALLVADKGTYQPANEASVANTIVARDSDNVVHANVFKGIATAARYADLAEKYTTDKDHPTGTVMTVCDHEGHETCPCDINDVAVGVVSEKPAYLMNAEADGQALALKGRVPVRVVGAVRKGQKIYTSENGVAGTMRTDCLVGIALETNNTESEKLVECVLKL